MKKNKRLIAIGLIILACVTGYLSLQDEVFNSLELLTIFAGMIGAHIF